MNVTSTSRSILAAISSLWVALSGSAALAVKPSKSLYTALDLSHCKPTSRAGNAESGETAASDSGWRRCEGLPGYPVYIAEDDLRYFVSVGPDAAKRRAASQTLGAFNTVFKGGAKRATVEWRFVIRDDKPAPYAMIVRYFTKHETRRGEVLVVTRVTATEACHIAYIDAVANANAIVLARRMADERARKLNCRDEPVRLGASGKSPM